MEAAEQVRKFEEFLDGNYKTELVENIRKGNDYLHVDFSLLSRFDPDLANLLLEDPENVLKAAEIAVNNFNLARQPVSFVMRVFNLPESQTYKIRNIRSGHLNKPLCIHGLVRQKSDVRPQVVSSRFECPSCGNIIPILQLDTKFREPSSCGCGRKGKFRLVSKELVDAQGIVLEEVPDQLEGGEQPKRMNILLKKDLVSPLSDRKTNPGTRIAVTGILKEVPIIMRDGGKSTKFELAVEANHVASVEEAFQELSMNDEQVRDIKKLSKDKHLFEKFISSVAPSIYGHEKIKEALVLQLFGGVRQVRNDGVAVRGDIHILLIGDPGAGKCLHPKTKIVCSDGSIKTIKEIVENNAGEKISKDAHRPSVKFNVAALNEKGLIENKNASLVWKRKSPKNLLKITTGTGNEVIVTDNHPFFVTDNGFIFAKQADELTPADFIATPRRLHVNGAEQPISIKLDNASKANNRRNIVCPKVFDEEMARLFGYLTGDGYVSYSQTSGWISFTNNNCVLLEDFARIMKKKFNAKITKRKSHKGKTANEYYSTSRDLVSILAAIEQSIIKKSAGKQIPDIINKSSNAVLKAFLRALYDCEGYVHEKKASVEISSASKDLIDDLKLALLRFGIIGFVNKKMKYAANTEAKIKRPYYELIIYGEHVDTFLKEIGFLSAKKQEKLRAVCASGKKHNTNTDIIPHLSTVLKAVRKEASLLQKDFGIPRPSYNHYEQGDRNPSRDQLRQIVETYKKSVSRFSTAVKILDYAAMSDVFWDKIESIEEINSDTEHVYDLQVDDTHNYIANAVVVHNSQLLKRISVVAPKARYVTGKGASGAGITAAVVKDEFMGGWSLEAGSLVLANQGICVIDELDKMTKEDRGAMHEALEQQTISISKANIQATLRAETTVLAAANPKLGRFDPFEPISRQIDLPPTLINRFDLIFPIKDLPDADKDDKLASFVLGLHKREITEQDISKELLRRYIAYAKQNVFPKLTDEAMDEIKKYYMKMRSSGEAEGQYKAVPISARQLEALVRLSEASARLRLSSKVEKADAQKAIDLVHYCLSQIGIDPETGKIDIDRIVTGITASQRSRIHMLREIIAELEAQMNVKAIPIEEITKLAKERGIDESQTDELIERLKRDGDLFEPRHGFISRI